MKKLAAVLTILCVLIFPLAACTLELNIPPGTEGTPPPSATTSEAEASTEPSPTSEATPSPPPSPSISMYTSLAYMVSFDPSTGEAEFDYWNMLQGDEAVQYLVGNKGYSLADAHAEVDNYADSEYCESNTNPQLRTIDLSAVPVRMMFHPDGAMLTGTEPIATSFADLCALYTAHPDLVLDSFFYRVIVSGDGSVKVDQVYWP